jgi:hypothetical protein
MTDEQRRIESVLGRWVAFYDLVVLRSLWWHPVLGDGVVTSLGEGVEITYDRGATVVYLTPQLFLEEGHRPRTGGASS